MVGVVVYVHMNKHAHIGIKTFRTYTSKKILIEKIVMCSSFNSLSFMAVISDCEYFLLS